MIGNSGLEDFVDKNEENQVSANRIPLPERMKKLSESVRIFVQKPYTEQKEDLEVNEIMDGSAVVGRIVKHGDQVVASHASPDMQATDEDEKAVKKVGGKKEDVVKTTASQVARQAADKKQVAPERPKEKETFESETKEKIKAPDSKEKKTKEPKDAKKPDTSMSKMASGESAETQGAAPLEKNYHVKRVGDTLQYTRLGAGKPKSPVGVPGPLSSAPVVPPHATQTPNQVATKAPSTGPDQSRGTGASPQQAPAPAPAGGAQTTAAPAAKQPPSTKWKEMFNARKKERDVAKVSGGKGYVTTRGTVMVKSDPEEFANTPGNRKRARDEEEQDRRNYGKDLYEKENPPEPVKPLKKDVVDFKKPVTKKPAPATPGHQGMFDVLKRGRAAAKPGTRDEKIKSALATQAAAGSPYAERRDDVTHSGVPAKETINEVKSEPKQAKPVLVRDMNRLKGHTQSGRPFRVMLATHQDHAELPGYHMGLDKDHSIAQIRKHLSNPIHPITKAVYSALERGHDKLIVHNPNQPFKAVK